MAQEAMPETTARALATAWTASSRATCAGREAPRQSHEAGVEMDDLRSMKKEMMDEVYHLLATCLGAARSFPVRLRDKDDKLVLAGTFTPKEFFSTAVDMDVDSTSRSSAHPRPTSPLATTVFEPGNVWEDHGVRYLNLPPAGSSALPSPSCVTTCPCGLGATLSRATCVTRA